MELAHAQVRELRETMKDAVAAEQESIMRTAAMRQRLREAEEELAALGGDDLSSGQST
jgi:hypothetical protein